MDVLARRARSQSESALSILLIEDDLGQAALIQRMLDKSGLDAVISSAQTLAAGLVAVSSSRPDCVLLDLGLPDSWGLEGVREFHRAYPHLPLVVLTGQGDSELALEAVRSGAQEFLEKGQITGSSLARLIRYAIERKQLEEELVDAQAIKNPEGIEEMEAMGSAASEDAPARPDDRQPPPARRDAGNGFALLHLVGHIAVLANESRSVSGALGAAVASVCEHTGWPVGHVYAVDAATGTLEPTEIWSLESDDVHGGFRAVTMATWLEFGQGLPGRAAATGAPAWIEDLAEDSDFPRAEVARRAGLSCGFAVPVKVGDETVAVLEFFTSSKQSPDRGFLDAMAHVGAQLGRVVERQRAGEELDRYRLAFHHAQWGMCLIDPSSDTLLLVNDALARMHGRTRGELEGTPVSDLFVPEERARVAERRAIADEQGHVTFESWHLRKDGTVFPCLSQVVALRDAEPQAAFRIATFVDITPMKAAEQELRSSREELARSNRELEQFAHVVSHDVREPLRTISGFVKLLDQRYRGRLDEDADRMLGFISEGSSRMEGLIHDLLEYSQVGRQPLSLEVFPLAEAVERALEALADDIEASGASVDVGPLPLVHADKTQLAGAIELLVANAIKFRGEEPVVVGIGGEQAGAVVKMWVEDNGIGIDPRHFERIFKLFQRLHTKDAYPGTGTGLAMAKRIVERHGGVIGVASEPGAGARFELSLPAPFGPT